jgi:type IV pilus assembly protein PilQ
MKPVLAVIVAAAFAAGPTARTAVARPAAGEVSALSVVPASGRAELVVGVTGATHVSEFTLASPSRIVVDIDGVSSSLPTSGYDKVARGGIADVRWSQFRKGTVRVVVYLDHERQYRIWRTANEVHVNIATEPGAQITPWHIGAGKAPTFASAPAPTKSAAPTTAVAAKPAASQPAPAPAVAKPTVTAAATSAPVTAAPKSEAPAVPTAAPTRVATTTAAETRPAGEPPRVRPEPARETEPADTDARIMRPVQQAQQRSAQPRITVTYQGSDIRDVLAAFAAFSGRTIIPSSAVPAAKVDAEIRDQPWDVALQAILASQGLAATEDANGIIIVDTQERIAARAATEPLVTRIVRLNYQRAAAVSEQIKQRLQQCIPSERSSSSAAGQPPVAGAPPAQPTMSGGAAPGSGPGSCVARGSVSGDSLTNRVSITAPSSAARGCCSAFRPRGAATPAARPPASRPSRARRRPSRPSRAA